MEIHCPTLTCRNLLRTRLVSDLFHWLNEKCQGPKSPWAHSATPHGQTFKGCLFWEIQRKVRLGLFRIVGDWSQLAFMSIQPTSNVGTESEPFTNHSKVYKSLIAQKSWPKDCISISRCNSCLDAEFVNIESSNRSAGSSSSLSPSLQLSSKRSELLFSWSKRHCKSSLWENAVPVHPCWSNSKRSSSVWIRALTGLSKRHEICWDCPSWLGFKLLTKKQLVGEKECKQITNIHKSMCNLWIDIYIYIYTWDPKCSNFFYRTALLFFLGRYGLRPQKRN